MRKEEIGSELTALAFEFFYWFSRFEFALKENGYLKSHGPARLAEPGWKEFVRKFEREYMPSPAALQLLKLRPNVQVVGPHGSLDWAPLHVPRDSTNLAQVVIMLKTVRNNLFHGGKHGDRDWDDPARTMRLLESGKAVLTQLAQLAGVEPDFSRYY